jgi:hypothetical protein
MAIAAISLMTLGCVDESKPYATVRFGTELVKWNYDVIAIEGCEYIQIGTGSSMSIAHKGNCKNPIHIYNIEKGTQLETNNSDVISGLPNTSDVINSLILPNDLKKVLTNISIASTNTSIQVSDKNIIVTSGNNVVTIGTP